MSINQTYFQASSVSACQQRLTLLTKVVMLKI